MPARILVVDDEPAIRQIMVRALHEEGHEVFSVADAILALQTVSESPIDLVVTNNRMPGMTGAQLIGALRERFPGLPVLHVDDRSHGASPEHRVPDDVVTIFKPFELEALQKTVRDLLKAG